MKRHSVLWTVRMVPEVAIVGKREANTEAPNVTGVVVVTWRQGRYELRALVVELVVRVCDRTVAIGRNRQCDRALAGALLADHRHPAQLVLPGIDVALVVQIVGAQRLHGARAGRLRVVR